MKREPAISDLAFLADRHAAALVDRSGAIVWCCLPRLDHGSVFGALLDAERGGHCTIAPCEGGAVQERRYLESTLVLETVWSAAGGRVRVLDLLVIDPDDPSSPRATLARVCEGIEGEVELEVVVAACFDYGSARPWIRPADGAGFRLTAGDDGLIVWSDFGLEREGDHGLHGRVRVREGERRRLWLRHVPPERLDQRDAAMPSEDEVDGAVDGTVRFWRGFAETLSLPDVDRDGVRTSALVLHGLTNARSGAVAAAATTSLPESAAGRTWDYRYSWVRDSAFTSRSMAEVGCTEEAEGFHAFILRSAAGNAGDVQVLYGVGGERRMPELEVPELRGWRHIGPVHVGNGAADQEQHDVLGELVALTWRRHDRGERIDEDDWRFVRALVDRAADRWQDPDRGIWEWRGGLRHFVHSKAMCWSALEHGLALARDTGFEADVERWERERDAVAATIDREGVDEDGVFLQAFGAHDLDAACLLLPASGFCAWDDPRMVATADAIRERLAAGALLRRYDAEDELPGTEHPFVACSFWLVEVLARQGRVEEARETFEAALRARTDLGIFSEEADGHSFEPWGNVPQALTHLAHIAAAQALGG